MLDNTAPEKFKSRNTCLINKRPWQLLACLQTVAPPSVASVHSCLLELQNPKNSSALRNLAKKFGKKNIQFFAQNVSMLQRIFTDNHNFALMCKWIYIRCPCPVSSKTEPDFVLAKIKPDPLSILKFQSAPKLHPCFSTYSRFRSEGKEPHITGNLWVSYQGCVPGCVHQGWRRLHPGWRASEGHPPILYTSTAPGINMLQEGDSIQRPLLLSLSVFFASLSDISLGWLSIIIGIYDIWSYPIIWPKVLFCVNEFLTLSVNLCNQVLVLKSKKVIIKASSKIIRGRSRSWSRAGSITLIFVVAGCTNIIEKLNYVLALPACRGCFRWYPAMEENEDGA